MVLHASLGLYFLLPLSNQSLLLLWLSFNPTTALTAKQFPKKKEMK